jgi:hypothetical protein
VYVVLCNVLSGSGYRLRATSKTGDVSDIAIYYEGLGLRWLNLAEHAQGTGGVVAQPSEAIGASSLRASDLDARHNICASLKKLYQELSPHLVQSQAP